MLTLNSPGIQIAEIDLSQTPVIPTGTNVLVLGFAPQGPTDAVIQVSDFADFQTIYGNPTNAAERYFYNSVQSVFNSPANVLVGRLSYGANLGVGFGNTYTALVYPVIPVTPSLSGSALGYLSAASLSGAVQGYIIGEPYQVSLNPTDYNTVVTGQVNWPDSVNLNTPLTSVGTFGNAGIIVLNQARTTIDNLYQGYYLCLSDNTYINPATNFTEINNIYSVNQNNGSGFVTIPSNRIGFALSAAYTNPVASISQVQEGITPFDASGAGFIDALQVGVYKLNTSIYQPNNITLTYNLVEGYTGSLDASRRIQNQNASAPSTFFLGNVESNSPNITILVNPNISTTAGSWLGTNGNPTKYVNTYKVSGTTDPNINYAVGKVLSPVDSLFPLGTYATANSTALSVGAVPAKVQRALSLVSNLDTVQIDITIEAGLGSVYVGSLYAPSTSTANSYDDTQYVNLSGANGGFYYFSQGLIDQGALNIQSAYESVANMFLNFAQNIRKDHIFIADPLRHIFVQGQSNVIQNYPSNTFSIYTYWPLKHLYENMNSSYMAVYADWFQMYDSASDSQFWCPPSGTLAAIYANTDATYQPWYAPAGFTRGLLSNVNELAISPNQPQRDMLYLIGLNSIANFPTDGFVVMGQKTLYGVPSAFNRVNVRRLFLFLEKATRATMKYFLFEPNTAVTRNRVVNNLTPIFEMAKNTQGLYDYLIICDERNNTGTTIDQNMLIVDIYLKPVRAAEFILVNFYACQSSFNFSEITG
jgi:hypothetical protein